MCGGAFRGALELALKLSAWVGAGEADILEAKRRLERDRHELGPLSGQRYRGAPLRTFVSSDEYEALAVVRGVQRPDGVDVDTLAEVRGALGKTYSTRWAQVEFGGTADRAAARVRRPMSTGIVAEAFDSSVVLIWGAESVCVITSRQRLLLGRLCIGDWEKNASWALAGPSRSASSGISFGSGVVSWS